MGNDFDDRNTHLYARLTGLNLGIDGMLGQRRSRLKVNFSTDNILFWQEGKLLVNRLALSVTTGLAGKQGFLTLYFG